MSLQHKDIPEAGLHEPKGVSTASSGETYQADGLGSGNWALPKVNGVGTAQEGMVYKADGLGSASWTYLPHGWGAYSHSGSTQVVNSTASKLVINGSGAATDEDFLPREIRVTGDSLWDVVDNKITPITIGDSYTVRVDIPIISETGSPVDINVDLDIGGSTTPTNIIIERFATAGKGTPYTISVAFPLYTKSDFVTNGGQIFLSTDSGTVTVSNPQIFIDRVGAGDL